MYVFDWFTANMSPGGARPGGLRTLSTNVWYGGEGTYLVHATMHSRKLFKILLEERGERRVERVSISKYW